MTLGGATHAVVLCAAAFLAGPGCGTQKSAAPITAGNGAPAPPPVPAAPVESLPRIVALGDSLTAGLGLGREQAYPALLQQRLTDAGLSYQVINAGVSGDTSAGGLRRLDWALDGDVRVLIVALGGNDALRGLPVEELRRNLSEIIERAQDGKVQVILAGMEAPPNFGHEYIVGFHEVYADLARKYDVGFVPFLLDGVAGVESMNQRDGIHPTAAGARRIADNVWAVLSPLVEGRSGRK